MDNTFVKIAYSWHGGQYSPMYSFASTGGVVHSYEHKHGLIREIDSCIASCKDELNREELFDFKQYVVNQHFDETD